MIRFATSINNGKRPIMQLVQTLERFLGHRKYNIFLDSRLQAEIQLQPLLFGIVPLFPLEVKLCLQLLGVVQKL